MCISLKENEIIRLKSEVQSLDKDMQLKEKSLIDYDKHSIKLEI